MTIRAYLNFQAKRTETLALLDCGATENFISEDFAHSLDLPIRPLKRPHNIYNVDGTRNKQGLITHYTDLQVRTGEVRKRMRFFLTSMGESTKVIFGYPWFTAVEPKINWSRGWLDYSHLPIVLSAPEAPPTVDQIIAQTHTQLRRMETMVHTTDRKQTIASKLAEQAPRETVTPLPREYQHHTKVFSEQEAQRFPGKHEWDHAIDLKDGARGPHHLHQRTIAEGVH
jgi:hypothetical protein